MRHGWSLIAVAGLWAGMCCMPAHAIMLRYTPAAGKTLAYSLGTSGSTRMEGMGVTVDGTFGGDTTYEVKTLGADPKGTKLSYEVRETTSEMKFAGEEKTEPMVMPGFAITMVLDDQGRMQDLSAAGAPTNGPAAPDATAVRGFCTFPTKEVKPGETWTDTIEVGGQGDMPRGTASVTARLVELTTYRGRRCARIETVATITDAGTVNGVVGTMEETAVHYYDYVNSVWVEREATAHIKTTSAPGTAEAETVTMTMTLKTKTSLADPPAPTGKAMKVAN